MNPKIRPSDYPNIRPSDYPRIRPSEYPNIRLSENPSIRKSHNPKILFSVAIFSLFFFQASLLEAQSDSTKSTYNESVIVVGDYTPVLDGVTEKVNVAPAVNENSSDNALPTFSYSITPRRISSLSATSGIKAAKVVASPTRLYNNYLKFGVGHDFASVADFTPLVDLYYTSTRHDNYSYGARLYHQTDVTTFGKHDDVTPSPDHYGRNRQSVTYFDVFGKYILNKEHLFSADLTFDREYGRYYGFSDSMLFNQLALNRSEIKHSDYALAYNNVALSMGAKSLNTDINKLGYEANMSMADFWSRYHANQLSIDIDASVHYGFPMFQKYKAIAYLHTNWRGYKQSFDSPGFVSELPLGYSSLAPLPDSVNQGHNLFTVGPFVDFLFKDMKFHVGLSLGLNGFDNSNSHVNLFPDIAVAKSFANNSMSLTVGWRGDYKSNDWNSIRLENPFTEPAPLSLATVDNDIFAHFRFNFSKKLLLNIHVDNNFYKNKLFFELNKDYSLHNVFKPYYIDFNEVSLGSDFTFVNDEMITMTLGFNYYIDYNAPENMPMLFDEDFNAHFDTKINYLDKWYFSLSTFFIGSMDADYDANTVSGYYKITETLPARFALAFEVEYVHSRALSFFAKFDNLTFKRYYLWSNYPAERFNAMVGLTYTIPNQ